MKKQSIIYSLAAIICLVTGATNAAEVSQAQPNVMFCTETDSNGFYYNKQRQQYERTAFTPSRHTINIIGALESISLSSSGSTSVWAMQCRPSRFTQYPHIRECSSNVGLFFTYNTSNNRFTLSTQNGYVYSDEDDIGIAYGTCARF